MDEDLPERLLLGVVRGNIESKQNTDTAAPLHLPKAISRQVHPLVSTGSSVLNVPTQASCANEFMKQVRMAFSKQSRDTPKAHA
jgi:hypothetical protein